MADKNIGALPAASSFDDASLLVVEQQGEAVRIEGAQLREFAEKAAAAVQKGDPGKDFQILGYYDTLDLLNAAQKNPDAGDAYGVGTAEPYTIYIWDGVNLSWKDNGTIQGPAGPQGPQGEQGPQGKQGIQGETGPKGEKGETGAGFKVLDYYASLSALQTAVPNPNPGDAYGVGTAEPYDIYIYGKTSGWVNNGPLQGAQGPEGPQGPQGKQGLQGERGPKGEQGPQGEQGAKGDTGATGPRGETGATGPQGPAGANGKDGAAGNDATINGVNALTLKTSTGLSGSQSGNTYTLKIANHAASYVDAGIFAGQVVANESGQAAETSCLRNSKLVSTDTDPTVNGEINWTYG